MVRDCKGNAEQAAKLLDWPREHVQTALNYAEAFPLEIGELIEEAEEIGFEVLRRKLPALESSNGTARPASRAKAKPHASIPA
jgi:hypothetical protein